MATSAGLSTLLNSENQWAFPRFDDQSPQAGHDDADPPRKAPRAVRIGVGLVIGIVVVALGISAAGVVVKAAGRTEIVAAQQTQGPVSERAIASASSAEVTLIIHVTGAVSKPGVIEIPEGARVFEAIEKAGGFTPDALSDAVNLARFLVDGEHLSIPTIGEELPAADVSGGRVSLSLASPSELETLPGIGPTIAARIVAWRETHGPFRHVDDVLAVSGIGPATLEGFRDQVVP